MIKHLLVCPVCEQNILTPFKRVTVGILRGIQCENCSNWLRINTRVATVAGIVFLFFTPKLVNWLMQILDLTDFHELSVDIFGILLGVIFGLLFMIFSVPLERDPRYKSVPVPPIVHEA